MIPLPRRRSTTASRRASIAPASGESPSERATRLLFEYLTDEQRQTYTELRFIRLVGSRKTNFCLHVGHHEIKPFTTDIAGNHTAQFCVHVAHRKMHPQSWPVTSFYNNPHDANGFPVADHMLTYYLLLTTNEQVFLQRAVGGPAYVGYDHGNGCELPVEPPRYTFVDPLPRPRRFL